jgi:glucose-1-phosphate thymidylyltransferase
MKGIILAGGSGTRLYPITMGVSKQLIPLYDKPMIYYPLSTLMQAGIRDILIISTPKDLPRFEELFGSGERIGCQFTYKVQEQPRGIAEAYIIGEDFIGQDKVVMILGDNLFYGDSMGPKLKDYTDPDGAVIFGAPVADPERYGIVDFDKDMKVTSIVEKPKNPRSNYAVPGLYFTDNDVVEIAKSLKPSARGELEITDGVMRAYLSQGRLKVCLLDRGSAWLDTGTFATLNQAAQFVQVIEERQGVKIGCIEEIAWQEGYITDDQLRQLADPLTKSGYGQYLLRLLEKN